MSGRTTMTFHKWKHCRVQFSLYRDVNIRVFWRKEINCKPQRILSKVDSCHNYWR